MNSQSAARQSAKEVQETINGIASDKVHRLLLISNSERHLENARIGVQLAKETLAQREAVLAELEAFIADPYPVIDRLDASLKEKTVTLALIKQRDRVQYWKRLNAEIAAMDDVKGDPEVVDEDSIVS